MILHFGSFPQLASGAVVPLSRAVRCGDFVFLSGQLGLDAAGRLVEGGIEVQAKQAFRNIEAALEEAGASLAQVVKASVWLTEGKDFAAFNEVYRSHFLKRPPARSTVISALVVPGAKVEIEVVAYVGA